MAEQLHIRIDDIIGVYYDCDMLLVGYMDFMLKGAIEANPDATDLVVHIDCPGGCTYEGDKIYNTLLDFRNTPGNTVRIINEAMAASMATVIMQAATPGMREARLASTFMVHKPLFSELSYVNADDLKKAVEQLDILEARFAKIYSIATGRTPDEIHADMQGAQFWSPDVAVAKGYLDKVLDTEPIMQAKNREAKAIAFYNPPKTQNLPINTKNENEMSDKKKPSMLDKLKAMAAEIMAIDEPTGGSPEETPAPVAASVTLADGSPLYFDGELAEGTAVFVDEAMTEPAADGTYELEDARSITVEAGAVTAIIPAVDETAQALAEKDAEISNLKAELESLKGVSAKVSEHEATISNLKTELEKVKNYVPGGGDNSPKPKQTYANYDQEKQKANPFNSAAEKLKNNLKK